ncbi:MAG: hypothetical protein INQ03_04280 [Candidatus Heimdallarchaeota archaeon]|nr:hypothetical protein [Candidatus Heimdallarchaeota archaeon]
MKWIIFALMIVVSCFPVHSNINFEDKIIEIDLKYSGYDETKYEWDNNYRIQTYRYNETYDIYSFSNDTILINQKREYLYTAMVFQNNFPYYPSYYTATYNSDFNELTLNDTNQAVLVANSSINGITNNYLETSISNYSSVSIREYYEDASMNPSSYSGKGFPQNNYQFEIIRLDIDEWILDEIVFGNYMFIEEGKYYGRQIYFIGSGTDKYQSELTYDKETGLLLKYSYTSDNQLGLSMTRVMKIDLDVFESFFGQVADPTDHVETTKTDVLIVSTSSNSNNRESLYLFSIIIFPLIYIHRRRTLSRM